MGPVYSPNDRVCRLTHSRKHPQDVCVGHSGVWVTLKPIVRLTPLNGEVERSLALLANELFQDRQTGHRLSTSRPCGTGPSAADLLGQSRGVVIDLTIAVQSSSQGGSERAKQRGFQDSSVKVNQPTLNLHFHIKASLFIHLDYSTTNFLRDFRCCSYLRRPWLARQRPQ